MPGLNFLQLLFGSRSISGSDQNELIFGSFSKDDFAGNGGNDLIFGFAGDDKLFGGDGDDDVFGGLGRDHLDGGRGNDNLFGGAGDDKVSGGEGDDGVFGGIGYDDLEGGDGEDKLFGGSGNDRLFGGAGNDIAYGGRGNDEMSGGDGEDDLFGGSGNDRIAGNKGNDRMFGGRGHDLLVWNNGDGSDLMDGGVGYDRVQVNFDTDLVNDDLQNKDVARFSTTENGVAFARIELNDQTERGLFQLDIRNTETLETNFGDGDDAAVIVGDVLDQILLDLDGGEGVDTLDLRQADPGVNVDLGAGTVGSATAVNFENVIGTSGNEFLIGDARDNVIRGGGGVDVAVGGAGADTFLFVEGDASVMLILDFELGVDRIRFETTDPAVTAEVLVDQLTQVGDDVELVVNSNTVTFEDAVVADFDTFDFQVA